MAKTFRQEVEEIQNPIKSCNDKLCEKYKSVGFNGWANCVQCRTDRICEAAVRMGKRMEHHTLDDGDNLSEHINAITKAQWEADQAHITKECHE